MSTTKDNLDLANRFFAALGSGDMDTAGACVAQDIRWTYHGDPAQIPFAGTFTGLAGIGAFFGRFMDVAEPIEMAPAQSWADGDKVFVRGIERSRGKATGREYSVDWIHVYEIRDGKIVSFDEYLDSSTVAAILSGPRT